MGEHRGHIGGAMLTIAGAALIAANPASTVLAVLGVLCIVGALWAFGAWGALWGLLRASLDIPAPQRSRQPVAVKRRRAAAVENPFRRKAIEHLKNAEQSFDPASAQGSGSAAHRQRELIERGEDLKSRVSMERTVIERYGRQTAQEHMLKEWTDAARSWGADAGFATEPPPIGFSPMGQPAAQRRALEDWIGQCVDALRTR